MSPYFQRLNLPDVIVFSLLKHRDSRGFLSETYSKSLLTQAGVEFNFVQENHVMSEKRGTIRGLHFQIPPFAQAKLVRVVRGAIFDVAVDIRQGSPTYGRHVSAVISAESWNQILVPVGFAHGLATLERKTEVLYKVSNVYSPEHERGVLWNDPALEIEWPLNAVVSSEKDRQQPLFTDLPTYFQYEGAQP